jgi:protein-tyrosine phosphatase
VFPSVIAASDPAELVLEGTRAVLVEFPGFWLDLDDPIAVVSEAAGLVEEAGLVPVLAHPERCRPVAADPESVRPLAERGWLLCLNAPSLIGGHGTTAERTGWALLDAGLVAVAASDAHSRMRPPALREAYEVVRQRRGDEIARPLFDGSALPWL